MSNETITQTTATSDQQTAPSLDQLIEQATASLEAERQQRIEEERRETERKRAEYIDRFAREVSGHLSDQAWQALKAHGLRFDFCGDPNLRGVRYYDGVEPRAYPYAAFDFEGVEMRLYSAEMGTYIMEAYDRDRRTAATVSNFPSNDTERYLFAGLGAYRVRKAEREAEPKS